MSEIETLTGQDTLPGQWPEPVMTADILIARNLEGALTQYEYFACNFRVKDDEGPERDMRIAKGNMHLFSFLLDAALTDLLIEIQGYSRSWADRIASELDDKFDSEYYGEMIWQWAEERGLDPDAIIETAKANFAAKEAS
ncbi:hypothetical protein SEA_RADFAD_83 [Arthrobacter phage RadFad]|nr:hypothetical protein SEA_RADFAD_83 [Arthrobacter phage RadFad]